jgi:hypothetical protein
MLRTVKATRYVTPLREGGSLPAIVEADDSGLYVVKFRGAGQGPLSLVAELISGEIGRALGLPIPEIVFIEIDAAMGRNEADPEIRELLLASTGLNLALDYLPGSFSFDPAVDAHVGPDLASRIVWFDAYIANVDRTPRNPNLLWWHDALYCIDHGASLYFHHSTRSLVEEAANPFPLVRDHVLLPHAQRIAEVDAAMHEPLTAERIGAIVNDVPDAWLLPQGGTSSADDHRARRALYKSFLTQRRDASHIFVKEALDAQSQLV